MVEIITKENRHFYQELIDEMHHMRYDVAITQLGWKVPGIEPGYEKDQFDLDETVYLIETNDARTQVLGCTRLNPTTGPHLIADVFPDSCDLQGIPRDPAIWECSRFLIDRKRCETKERNTLTRQRLGIAMSEFCIANDITHITWLTYELFYNNIIGVYDTEPLGLPRHYPDDDATYVPAISKVDHAGLARQRAKLIKPQNHIAFMYSPIQVPTAA